MDPKDPSGSEETDSYFRWTRVHAFIFYPPSGWLVRNGELKNFRQLHSKTPGHPDLTPGVECTTGPLGQGAAMSIGMAVAGKHFGARLDKLFNNKTWVLLGDVCMRRSNSRSCFKLATLS